MLIALAPCWDKRALVIVQGSWWPRLRYSGRGSTGVNLACAQHWGHTPGGAVFSLNPLDQARLLAVGFHILIETLVRADIPILFLEFPRLVEDGAYLFNKLQPWLPRDIREEQGLAAHRRVADVKLIRVRHEHSAEAKHAAAQGVGPSPMIAYDDHAVLDQLAIRRESERLRSVEAELKASRSWRTMRPLRRLAAAIRAAIDTD